MDETIKNSENWLRQLETKGGFTTPPGYTEALADSLFFNCTMKEDAMHKALPEAYFENLTERVMQRIEAKEVKQAQLIPLYTSKTFRWVSAVAATVLLSSVLYLYAPSPVNTQEMATETNAPMLKLDEVADEIEARDLDIDFLCDAGWCQELDKLETGGKAHKLDDYILNTEEELIIEEL